MRTRVSLLHHERSYFAAVAAGRDHITFLNGATVLTADFADLVRFRLTGSLVTRPVVLAEVLPPTAQLSKERELIVDGYRTGVRLKQQEERLLRGLWGKGGAVLVHPHGYVAMDARPQNLSKTGILKVVTCHLNRKLRAACSVLEVRSVFGVGYYISEQTRASG